jgi:alpha-maltose-1-phosphate synthase
MKVVYTAPTRAHHYTYAIALFEAGILRKFVSGFPRISPRSPLPEIGNTLYRSDMRETFSLLLMRLGLPEKIIAFFSYYSKVGLDDACKKFLVHTNDVFFFYNGSGLNSCRYAKSKGILTVVETVTTHVDYQERILREEHLLLKLPFVPFQKQDKERRMKEYEEADYIVVPSEFVRNSFLQYGFPQNKLFKVPYGFNTYKHEKQNQETSSNTQTFTVLYVGSISVRKGLRYLIKAFEKFNHPRKKLVLVGSTSVPSGIEDIQIPDTVSFTGPLKGKDLEEAYQQADVFCLPSIEDGFGLVLGEALSYGIPVISTTNTGAYDIIVEGENGFIVPIRDEESISSKLQLLADDRDLLNQMKAAAIASAGELKGWAECKEKLVTTLCGLTKLS